MRQRKIIISMMRKMITMMRKTKLALRGQVISDRVGERPNATLTVTAPLPPSKNNVSLYFRILTAILLPEVASNQKSYLGGPPGIGVKVVFYLRICLLKNFNCLCFQLKE